MSSPSPALPVEILDLILLIILPGAPGLVSLLWPVLSLLRPLLLLLDMIVVSVVHYLPAPALLQPPVVCHLGNHLVQTLLALRSGWPSLLASGVEV